MSFRKIRLASICFCLFTPLALGQESLPSVEELWNIIQRQQVEIDELRTQLEATQADTAKTTERVEVTENQIEATGDFVEALASEQSSPSKTTIAGYGELHYNNFNSDSAREDEIDFHRFVLYFGHEFNERTRLFSELEIEHSLAGDDKPGEVELEQAYIDFMLNDHLSAMGGLFLLPVGLLNETHEPNTFYGVERNDVENIIIPTTWWEAGAAMYGHLDNGLSWNAAVHSGLAIPTEGSSAFRVRSGRQKVAEALASDPAYTFRLKYTGLPGLELAASYQYQSDASQVADDGLDAGHLLSAQARFSRGPFSLTGLYGAWRFNGSGAEAVGADRQSGWYIEPSWRFNSRWGIYARYEDLEGARAQDQFTQTEFGFNFWPLPAVVVKFDYRDRIHDLPGAAGQNFSAIDLGIGYAFN